MNPHKGGAPTPKGRPPIVRSTIHRTTPPWPSMFSMAYETPTPFGRNTDPLMESMTYEQPGRTAPGQI